MTQFTESRRRMVDSQLRTTDVTDSRILDAMGAIAREDFVGENQRALAYLDRDNDLGAGRRLASPSALARFIQLADPRIEDRVLIIGSGTGYGAAIVASLAGKVVALESNAAFAAQARAALAPFTNVDVMEGPLPGGAPAHAPFNLILIEGAVPDTPEELFSQLEERGRMVCAEGAGTAAMAKVYVKEGPVVSSRRAFNLALPALREFDRKPAFVF